MLETFLNDPEIRAALEYGDKYGHFQPEGPDAHRENVEIYLASEPNPDRDIIILILIGHAIEHMDIKDVSRLFGRVISAFSGDDPEDVSETPLSAAFHEAMLKMSVYVLEDGVADTKESARQVKGRVAAADQCITTLQDVRRLVEFRNAEKPDGYKLN